MTALHALNALRGLFWPVPTYVLSPSLTRKAVENKHAKYAKHADDPAQPFRPQPSLATTAACRELQFCDSHDEFVASDTVSRTQKDRRGTRSSQQYANADAAFTVGEQPFHYPALFVLYPWGIPGFELSSAKQSSNNLCRSSAFGQPRSLIHLDPTPVVGAFATAPMALQSFRGTAMLNTAWHRSKAAIIHRCALLLRQLSVNPRLADIAAVSGDHTALTAALSELAATCGSSDLSQPRLSLAALERAIAYAQSVQERATHVLGDA